MQCLRCTYTEQFFLDLKFNLNRADASSPAALCAPPSAWVTLAPGVRWLRYHLLRGAALSTV